MSWKDALESTGGPKMQEGYHRIRVTDVLRHKKNGFEFKSQAGPFFMVIVENADQESATMNLWCTVKAKGMIARALSALGVDMDELDAAGVGPDDFLSAETCREWFVGREGWGLVKQDGQYTNITLIHEDEVPANVVKEAMASAPKAKPEGRPLEQHEPLDDDDIPF